MKRRYFRLRSGIVPALLLVVMFLPFFCGTEVYGEEKPEIFPQLGQSGWIQKVAMSKDGKILLTGDFGGGIMLWDVGTGREIRKFGGQSRVSALDFTPDGRHAVSLHFDIVSLWDLRTGKEVYSAKIKNAVNMDSLSFISGGKYVMIFGFATPVYVWETVTGREIGGVSLPEDFVQKSGTIVASPGTRFALTQVYDRSRMKNEPAKIWDLATGRVIRELDRSIPFQSVFTKEGNRILSVSYGDNSVELLDSSSGRVYWSGKGHSKSINYLAVSDNSAVAVSASDDDRTMRVWDMATGRQLQVISMPAGFKPQALSPDGRKVLLLYGFFSGDNKTAKLFDTMTGREIRTFHDKEFESMAFTPDGRLLLAGVGKVVLWDAAARRQVQRFEGSGESVMGVTFAPKGNVAAITGGSRVSIWDMAAGRRISVLKGHEKTVAAAAFSPDARSLVTGSLDNTLRIWDLKAGQQTLSMPGHKGGTLSVAWSPDGHYLASAGNDALIKLWDSAGGAPLKTLSGHVQMKSGDINASFNGIYNVAFSPDGKRLISCGTDGAIKLWDIATGKEIRNLKGHKGDVTAVGFSPDGRTLVSGGLDSMVRIWDANSGKEIKTLGKMEFGSVASVGFSPDGRYVAAHGKDENSYVWEVASGSLVRKLSGVKTRLAATGIMNSTSFSPDSRFLITNDGFAAVSRLWDIASGRELVQFISFNDGEWIAYTPEGFFNASPNGAKHLNVRVGNQVYSIDNFYEKFFNPVYVASVLQGKRIEELADIRKGIMSPPDVQITSPKPDETINKDTISVTVSAKDTGGGIDEIRLYHNGKAVGEDTRAIKLVSKGKDATKTYTVTLIDGSNTFRAVGFSKDRTESNPYELVVHLSAQQKEISMHVFAVGINKYRNPALNLNYAVPDAKGIATFFKEKGIGLFKKVEVTDIFDENATKVNITAKLKSFEKTNPQDAVLIYLAGHGENISDKWYFIPYELAYPEREDEVKSKGISSDEIAGLIRNIKAQKVLVMIDSCKAGAMLIAMRGFEDRKALSQLSRSTGVHVIAASTKDQFAAEVKDLGHGVFTYTLLEGLKGQAAMGDKTVTVRKLMTHVENHLPDITMKYRKEAQFPVVDSRGMDFPLVILK